MVSFPRFDHAILYRVGKGLIVLELVADQGFAKVEHSHLITLPLDKTRALEPGERVFHYGEVEAALSGQVFNRNGRSRGDQVIDRPVRILVAKPGLDGHDRGAKIIARALRDAGFEVIYTGLHQTPEMIVEAALQEDVDGIGLSILSGAHLVQFPAVMDLLRARDAGDIKVFGGGIIPEDDIVALAKLGVAKVFTPGATTQEIIDWVRQNIAPRTGD